jgi:hypothetical protein
VVIEKDGQVNTRKTVSFIRGENGELKSAEVVEDGKKFQPGMIINSLTKEILPAKFIPVFKFTNWIRFNPRNSKDDNFDPAYGPGDIIWRSNDPLDPRVQEESKFGPNGEPPIATKFLNFFCYFPGVNMPLILSFSKTSFGAGKRLLSLAQFSGKDMFATKYKVASKQEIGEVGAYFVFVVDLVGAADEPEYALGFGLWEQYANKPIQVHDEAPEETTQQ